MLAQSLDPCCLVFNPHPTPAVFTTPLGDIQLSSHISCSCLGFTCWDFCNRSEALHPLRSTAKSEITVPKPRHQNEVNAGTWSAQLGKHGKSTVDQGEKIPFLGFGSPPLLGFILSPLDTISPNHGRGAIPVHAARQTCGEVFLPIVVWQPSSGQTVASP